MQSRILTRFTTFVVFVFTCCLTVHVVANERELAPLLSPEGWQLLNSVEAYSKGFNPTKSTGQELEPRRGIIQTELVKRPNSRVKVKFNDNYEIRLDVHNKPYSRTQRDAQSIAEICSSLGVTLTRTISQTPEEIDALIRKAENVSRKQQPDIAGIYWINGDPSSVDVAAELFFTMEEVEWVLYKPVYSKMQPSAPEQSVLPQAKPINTEVYGACLHNVKDQCAENITETLCHATGGIFLGNGSICNREVTLNSRRSQRRENNNFIGGGIVGACCLPNNTCVDNVGGIGDNTACGNAGGFFAGAATTCATFPCSGVAGVVAGECCVLNADGVTANGCVIVATEGQCVSIYNGVFLGINTDVPPTPCDASQTDCPTGIGPAFATYSLCATDGDFITYLSGDCYIDQTTVTQTSRVATSAGCVDTLGILGGPGGTLAAPLGIDYNAFTGAPLGGFSNVNLGSTCCETIGNDVPDCAPPGAWTAICASYAQAYAVLGTANACLRSPAAGIPSNNCFAPLGPTQDRSVQPGINMNNVGAANEGIVISNPTGGLGADTTCTMQVLDPTGNGCADGDCTLNLTGDVTGPVVIPMAGGDIAAIALLVNIAGDGWTAVVNGPGTGLRTAINPTGVIPVFATALSFPQSITTVPYAGGCASGVGAPTFPRSTTTPDYAAMGLLTNLTPQLIPWPGNLTSPAQLLAFPSDATTLTPDQLLHISQLLPWPMAGSPMQGGALTLPLSGTAGNLGWYGGDGGMDLFPTAANPGGFGGAEVYLGSYGYGQFWADDGVGPVGGNGQPTSGAYGNGVKVAVLDWSAYVQQRAIVSPGPDNIPGTGDDVIVNLGGIHEEFLANGVPGTSTVTLEGLATGHNPVTLLFDENMQYGYSADHGTAVLGVIGANWSTNSPLPGAATYPPNLPIRRNGAGGITPNIGVMGLAPDADLYFFPLATNTVADRQDQAWFNAIETMDAGDVICAAYRPVSISDGLPNLNYWPDTSAYLTLANGLGICTVIRAGDRGVDLNAIALPDGDQNTMVATAVTPGAPFKRLANGTQASNFTTGTADYASATASGFGLGVVACGKGPARDNYLGFSTIAYAGAGTPYPSPSSDPHIVNAQSYTNNFSGTSAAAAQLAGCVAQVQGFTRQIYGVAMGPLICRQLMAGGKYEGRNRDGSPNLAPAPPGYAFLSEQFVDSGCDAIGALTWDFCAAATGNLTGNMLNPRGAMVNAIINPIFETPSISNTMFIRGTWLFGNIFSLAAADGNLLAATPVRTSAHIPYNLPATTPQVPGGAVRYLGNGLTTDLYLTGILSDDMPFNNAMTVDVTLFSVQQDSMYLMLEMYDQRTGRWKEASAASLLVRGDIAATFQVEGASNYINAGNNSYHVRLVTLDLNSPNGGPSVVYPVYYDQVLVSAGYIQH